MHFQAKIINVNVQNSYVFGRNTSYRGKKMYLPFCIMCTFIKKRKIKISSNEIQQNAVRIFDSMAFEFSLNIDKIDAPKKPYRCYNKLIRSLGNNGCISQ